MRSRIRSGRSAGASDRDGTCDDVHGKPPFKGRPGRPLPSPAGLPEHVVEVVGKSGRGDLVHERRDLAARSARTRSCHLPSGDRRGLVVELGEVRSQLVERPVQPRLRGPDRDPDRRRDLGQRELEVVVQDDDRPCSGGSRSQRRHRGGRGRRTPIAEVGRWPAHRAAVSSTSIGAATSPPDDVQAGSDHERAQPAIERDPDRGGSAGRARRGGSLPGPRLARARGPGGSGGRPSPAARHACAGKLGEGVMIAIPSPARRALAGPRSTLA